MAECTRQEFADLCGIDVKSLNVYISRKKVIVSGKTIDTTNPVNKAFKDKQKAQAVDKKKTFDLIKSIPVNPNKGRKLEPDDEDGAEPLPDSLTPEAMMALFAGNKGGRRGKADDDEFGGMQRWVLMKIKGDAELVSIRVEKEQLLLDKAAGKLVPIELARDVLKSHSTIIFSNFENAMGNIATVYCEIMAGGNMDLYTRIITEMRRELEAAIKRAGEEANVELANILSNYADGRGNKL